VEAYERLKNLVAEASVDVMKGAGGNKAAKVRARKKMQEIKQAAQDVREALLAGEAADGAEGGEEKA
jgi:hypothetical protein